MKNNFCLPLKNRQTTNLVAVFTSVLSYEVAVSGASSQFHWPFPYRYDKES